MIRATANRWHAMPAPWRKNLAESYKKIGDLLIARGRTREALKHYQNALEFVQDLAAKHPDIAQWSELAQSLKGEIEKLTAKL